MQISLNIIDILCLHILFWIRSNSRITFRIRGELIYVLSIESTRDTYNYIEIKRITYSWPDDRT